MKHTLAVLSLIFACALTAQDVKLARGPKLFFKGLEGFDIFLKAEIVKKKIPLQLVAREEDAEYILQGTAQEQGKQSWHEGWLSREKDHYLVGVELLRRETGEFIWASEAGDRSWWWGRMKRGGPRKAAERIAENLKNIFK